MSVFGSLKATLEGDDTYYNFEHEDPDALDIFIEEDIRNLDVLPQEVLAEQDFEDKMDKLESFINICEESIINDSIDIYSVMAYIDETNIICELFNMSLENFDNLNEEHIEQMWDVRVSIEDNYFINNEINYNEISLEDVDEKKLSKLWNLVQGLERNVNEMKAEIKKNEEWIDDVEGKHTSESLKGTKLEKDLIKAKSELANSKQKLSGTEKQLKNTEDKLNDLYNKMDPEGKSAFKKSQSTAGSSGSQSTAGSSRAKEGFKSYREKAARDFKQKMDDINESMRKTARSAYESRKSIKKFNVIASSVRLAMAGLTSYLVFHLIKSIQSTNVVKMTNKVNHLKTAPIGKTNGKEADIMVNVISMSDLKSEINNVKKCCNDLVKISSKIYKDPFSRTVSSLNSSLSKCNISVDSKGKIGKTKSNKSKMSRDTLKNKGYTSSSAKTVISMNEKLIKIIDNSGDKIKINYESNQDNSTPDSIKSSRVINKAYKTLVDYSNSMCIAQAGIVIKALERASK